MLHRHATAACTAALVAAGALVLTGLPAAVASETPTPPAGPSSTVQSAAALLGADRPSPEVLRALQRDLGLTDAQARARLVNEAEAGAIAGRLRAALGTRFAGAWVRGATSATVTVATTDSADVATIKAGGAEAEVVRYGLAELEAAKAKLDQAATTTRTLDAPVWYVDVRTNTVTLEAAEAAAAEALLTASGLDRALVRVRTTDERPQPLAHDLRGGDAYYIGAARCSIGFSVTSGTQQGFATAGHCGKEGNETTGHNKAAQGAFKASKFPENDMAWVATNADWTGTPYVKGEAEKNVEVTGSTEALVGASICRSGSTTGWHCGTVEQHSTSVTYPQGTVTGMTRTTVCAEPGDSGGAYLSGSQAQGVTSGGSGNCTSGGTTYHQPINPILQAYGLTLKTTASQPGEAGKSGGTWAAGKVYAPGDQVTYDGVTYRCIQSHQAQSGWNPAAAPVVWQRA
ncbi:alpha-lytic protease prodomain-containing protein [Streptomyces sp. NPDC093546]|uniref:alpha-lytic protease prodomain-containing protein n=1 Tax=Streptomyces sp. NPDC093546 TaxID=3366040 RepID=UPI0037F737C4